MPACVADSSRPENLDLSPGRLRPVAEQASAALARSTSPAHARSISNAGCSHGDADMPKNAIQHIEWTTRDPRRLKSFYDELFDWNFFEAMPGYTMIEGLGGIFEAPDS